MTSPNGTHHIAISTADIKGQLEFFTDVLGMELVGLFVLHGVPNGRHCLLQMGEQQFAFVFMPDNKDKEIIFGHTHSGSGAGSSAPGTLQHFAFNVDSQADLLAMRDRIRSRGVPCFGPLNHGLCRSIYFAGPEGLSLEVATSDGCADLLDSEGTWLDAEVVAEMGISDEELQKFRNPAAYKGKNGTVAQPAYDPSKPHTQQFSLEDYKALLTVPDDILTADQGYEIPPGKQG